MANDPPASIHLRRRNGLRNRPFEPWVAGASGFGWRACAAFGLPLAWVSTTIGQHYAPLLLFPFATGAVVGACLVGAMRVCQMHRRGIATLAAVLTGLGRPRATLLRAI